MSSEGLRLSKASRRFILPLSLRRTSAVRGPTSMGPLSLTDLKFLTLKLFRFMYATLPSTYLAVSNVVRLCLRRIPVAEHAGPYAAQKE